MKLAHIALENSIDFKDEKIVVWNIEDPQIYYQFVKELKSQNNGEDGNFILSNSLKNLKIDSDVEIVVGPFDMSFNSKKLMTAIAKRIIKSAVEDEYFIKYQDISKNINEYLSELTIDADLPVEVEPIEIENLIKAATFKINENNSFYDNLINYISLVMNLVKPKLFILANIKPYIEKEKYNEFSQFLQYEDVNVLFIDYSTQDDFDKNVRTYFLDKDRCEFEYSINGSITS